MYKCFQHVDAILQKRGTNAVIGMNFTRMKDACLRAALLLAGELERVHDLD
jgi:hypothetical protein